LIRTRYGAMTLPPRLKCGRWEEMDEHAVRDLLSISGMDKNFDQNPGGKTRGEYSERSGGTFEKGQGQRRAQNQGQGQGRSQEEDGQGRSQRGDGRGQGQGRGRSRQPDPLQTSLGFPGMGQPRRNAGSGRSGGGQGGRGGQTGQHGTQGVPRRRPRG
jgi:23S rRNA pseudouridine2605 synthase